MKGLTVAEHVELIDDLMATRMTLEAVESRLTLAADLKDVDDMLVAAEKRVAIVRCRVREALAAEEKSS